jgi:response regulator of citrate/malate metabolism
VAKWRVLVVEDDREVASLHCRYVDRQPGFTVVGVALTAEQALEMVHNLRPHLLLLDLGLPGVDGLVLLRRLRASGSPVEAIAVTAAREGDTVRATVQLGVVDYLVKPFHPDRLRQALGAFLRRMATVAPGGELAQTEIDALTTAGTGGRRWLPKDLQPERLEDVRAALAAADEPLSAEDLAGRTGIARTTARRYLEYLVTVSEATVEQVSDGPGRPRKAYRASP